jgi:hypothetical protein
LLLVPISGCISFRVIDLIGINELLIIDIMGDIVWSDLNHTFSFVSNFIELNQVLISLVVRGLLDVLLVELASEVVTEGETRDLELLDGLGSVHGRHPRESALLINSMTLRGLWSHLSVLATKSLARLNPFWTLEVLHKALLDHRLLVLLMVEVRNLSCLLLLNNYLLETILRRLPHEMLYVKVF